MEPVVLTGDFNITGLPLNKKSKEIINSSSIVRLLNNEYTNMLKTLSNKESFVIKDLLKSEFDEYKWNHIQDTD